MRLDKNIKISIFGESHGGDIGCVLDGMPCGIKVYNGEITAELARRCPKGDGITTLKKMTSLRLFRALRTAYCATC